MIKTTKQKIKRAISGLLFYLHPKKIPWGIKNKPLAMS
jgi:hypothetical protein